VTPEEIRLISSYIGADPERFVQTFCQISGGRPLLAQQKSGYCIFWNEGCTIHPVKPRMCRAWPFIAGVLADPRNWFAMAESCPGMRSDVSAEEVIAAVASALDSEKE
jgi:Fe-S-cluster containining protein